MNKTVAEMKTPVSPVSRAGRETIRVVFFCWIQGHAWHILVFDHGPEGDKYRIGTAGQERKQSMTTAGEKKELILNHEIAFAAHLARQVVQKPKLSVWMILIPIIFVFYFYQLQRYSEGRTKFIDHYLMSRRRVLDEAAALVIAGVKPDIARLAALSDVPEDARGLQGEVLTLLVEHFANLLRAEGEDFDDLVRSAYGVRTNYLLIMNRLNQAEKAVYAAVASRLEQEAAGMVVKTIEAASETFRREEAERIFPG